MEDSIKQNKTSKLEIENYVNQKIGYNLDIKWFKLLKKLFQLYNCL